MQDPVHEITGVVKSLVMAKDATDQRDSLQRYFAPDASFDHLMCSVASSANSRDTGILPIYQWLRIMFTSRIQVHNVAFDKQNNKIFLDATQQLTPNVFPLSLRTPACRLIVVLLLQRGADGRFYIKRQEDYYQLQTLPGKMIPGGETAVSVIKQIIGLNCLILALFFRLVFGIWQPRTKN